MIERIKQYYFRKNNSKLFGFNYFRSKTFTLPKALQLGKRTYNITFDLNDPSASNTFNEIFLDDIYGMTKFKNSFSSIIDIGGNLGFFSLQAQILNPRAKIHIYEPSKENFFYIKSNLSDCGVEVFNEAVGLSQGKVRLINSKNLSSTGVVEASSDGEITQIPINEALQKYEGFVDLLKMDCEGSEWDILNEQEISKKVKFIVMEYHLDQPKNRTRDGILLLLKNRNFNIQSESKLSEDLGIIWAKNNGL